MPCLALSPYKGGLSPMEHSREQVVSHNDGSVSPLTLARPERSLNGRPSSR